MLTGKLDVQSPMTVICLLIVISFLPRPHPLPIHCRNIFKAQENSSSSKEVMLTVYTTSKEAMIK